MGLLSNIYIDILSYPTFCTLSDVSDIGRQSSETAAVADCDLLPEARALSMQRAEILALW